MPHPFFRRILSEADLGPDVRNWNRGQNGTGRHYSVAVRRRSEPLSIRLHWLEQGTLVLVGYFVADMAGLRSIGLTVKDSKPEHDRYQFLRRGNSIYLEPAGDHTKSLFIGVVPVEEARIGMSEEEATDATLPDYVRRQAVGAAPSNEAPEDQSAAAQAVHQQLITEQEQQLVATGVFDPDNVRDARERIMASIVRRRGQPAFRRQLLRAYKGKCAISGCGVEATLDAAHIVPYKGPETNYPANGLLLRTDLHTLFDLGLIAIEMETMSVLVAPSLTGSCYQEYTGKRLCLPSDPASCPSREALDQHRASSSIPKCA